MTTEKLYWRDAYREEFEAERCTLSSLGDRPTVVCDATVFYPEAGGQLGDRGVLLAGGNASLGLEVVDTQIDEVGTIHHVLAAMPSDEARAALARGVRGRVDGARRVTQRAQHTAQHMLSCALLTEASAATASARLGTNASTIDVERDTIDDAALARAEDLVNAVIRDNLTVSAFFPDAARLASLPLRRPPKVSENVRIVAVGDDAAYYDVTPCGGTHVSRTGEIGAVRVASVERYKGMTRVTFIAAAEAINDARAKHAALVALGRELSCGPLDVPSALLKLRADLKTERDAATKLRGELADAIATNLLASAAASPSPERAFVPIVHVHDGADVSFLRSLAGRLTERADVVAAIAASGPNGASIVVQRGAAARFDCGAFWKGVIAPLGGRGGGSSARAEGRAPGPMTREFLETQLRVAEAERA